MRQVFYCKLRQLYYKMQQLLQNATFITNYDSTQFILDLFSLMAAKYIQNSFKF